MREEVREKSRENAYSSLEQDWIEHPPRLTNILGLLNSERGRNKMDFEGVLWFLEKEGEVCNNEDFLRVEWQERHFRYTIQESS